MRCLHSRTHHDPFSQLALRHQAAVFTSLALHLWMVKTVRTGGIVYFAVDRPEVSEGSSCTVTTCNRRARGHLEKRDLVELTPSRFGHDEWWSLCLRPVIGGHAASVAHARAPRPPVCSTMPGAQARPRYCQGRCSRAGLMGGPHGHIPVCPGLVPRQPKPQRTTSVAAINRSAPQKILLCRSECAMSSAVLYSAFECA